MTQDFGVAPGMISLAWKKGAAFPELGIYINMLSSVDERRGRTSGLSQASYGQPCGWMELRSVVWLDDVRRSAGDVWGKNIRYPACMEHC